MSVSPDFSDVGSFNGRRAIEKPNFSQTCNLFSQYLKGKGSLGDLSLGITSNNMEPKGNRQTRNFMEVSGDVSVLERNPMAAPRNVNSMDFFPRHSGFGTEDVVAKKTTDFRPVEQETAQMTIFYGGQVLVFDKFSAERAKEVMLLATKASSSTQTGYTSTSGNDQRNTQNTSPQLPPRPHISDLPIARKASLHRFLEKRKDRLTAKLPYQLSNTVSTQTEPPESKKMWLGLSSEPAKTLQLQL